MNGLIGAWFRTGIASYRELGEGMAWAMIQQRLKHVNRPEPPQLESPLRPFLTTSKLDYRSLFLIPNATIETFTVLMEEYRKHRKHEELLDLYQTLEKAKVAPNTYFMNQILMSETKHTQDKFAKDTYLTLVGRGGVHPDCETFLILWKIMKWNSGKVPAHRLPFFGLRELFAEMIRRAPAIGFWDEDARELYNTVVLCFAASNDQVGLAIALRAMQRRFDMLPNEITARQILLQLASFKDNSKKKLIVTRVEANLKPLTTLLRTLTTARIEFLASQGVVFNDLNKQTKMEESLTLIIDLLVYLQERRMEEHGGSTAVGRLYRLAAVEMGVPQSVPLGL